MRHKALLVFALGLVVGVTWGAKQFVAVPEVSWTKLSPYVEANIRVEYVDGDLTVGVSSEAYERKLFEPYDPTLGEFASVLLLEGLREGPTQKLLRESAEAVKESGVDVNSMDRNELTALYWQELTKDEQFMARIEKVFRKARAKGRIECLICGEGFEPQHLERL